MQVRPEEGMEVVATGRMTTFPGQSKYQMIVEDVAPAGAGALMAMLEKRQAALAAEGLFDAARKKPIPYLPEVIGVVTSPSGAVIRDILHRLRDRFPRHVLIWPVAVQGQACAPEVAAAIRGFNAIAPGGPIPRPDVIIVARGGGSLEDLWGFNEEIVVRAAAASRHPADLGRGARDGHDADRLCRRPARAHAHGGGGTGGAGAAGPAGDAGRAGGAAERGRWRRGWRCAGSGCAIWRAPCPGWRRCWRRPAQRLDCGRRAAGRRRWGWRWRRSAAGSTGRRRRLRPEVLRGLIARRGERLAELGRGWTRALARRDERRGDRLEALAARLAPALHRMLGDAARRSAEGRAAAGAAGGAAGRGPGAAAAAAGRPAGGAGPDARRRWAMPRRCSAAMRSCGATGRW